MTTSDSEQQPQAAESTVLQKIGAGLVTFIALWLLFGIPAYLLFGVFFR